MKENKSFYKKHIPYYIVWPFILTLAIFFVGFSLGILMTGTSKDALFSVYVSNMGTIFKDFLGIVIIGFLLGLLLEFIYRKQKLDQSITKKIFWKIFVLVYFMISYAVTINIHFYLLPKLFS